MLIPKSLLLAAVSLGAVLLVLAVLVRLLENTITFHPTSALELSPADYGLDYREVRLKPDGGDISLHGWYFAPQSDNSPVILACHGNAGNISHRLEWVVPMVGRGWGVLLFDYRGYGLSTGKPSEQGLYADADAAYGFLTGELGIDPGQLVIFGRSLGGAVAARLAARQDCGRLILEGTFTSGAAMSGQLFGFLPLHLASRYRWDTRGELRSVRVPVLILHGTADRVVPFRLGKKLAESAGDGQAVVFSAVQGGDHLDLHHVMGNEYYEIIAGFIGWEN